MCASPRSEGALDSELVHFQDGITSVAERDSLIFVRWKSITLSYIFSFWSHCLLAYCPLPDLTAIVVTYTMSVSRVRTRILLLQCLITGTFCTAFTFTEEPAERAAKSDGYCSRILRAQGARKESYNEFRLRVEGDPENYQPGSTYRGTYALWKCHPLLSQGVWGLWRVSVPWSRTAHLVTNFINGCCKDTTIIL